MSEAWTKARDEAADKRSKRQCSTGHVTLDKAVGWYFGFEDGADFGRSYGRTEILSSPELRGLVEALDRAMFHINWLAKDSKKYAGTDAWASAERARKEVGPAITAFKARFPGEL